jgi:hypothetical protein
MEAHCRVNFERQKNDFKEPGGHGAGSKQLNHF